MWYLIVFREIHEHLEDLHISVNWYFPNGQWMMLQNPAWIKHPFKVWEWAMNFDTTEYREFIHMGSGSILQLIIKKLPLFEFWYDLTEECSHLSEKAIKCLSLFQLYVCVQQIMTDWWQKNIGRVCLLLSRSLKRLTETQTMTHFAWKFLLLWKIYAYFTKIFMCTCGFIISILK